MSIALDFYNEYSNSDWLSHELPDDITKRYEIKACLKMSEEKQVYLVTSKINWRKFILKALASHCLESLEEEYKLSMKLAHPGIVSVVEYIKGKDYNYLIRDYVDGYTVSELVEMTEVGHLQIEELHQIAMQLCDIMIYLHTQNPPIIHRDIKPDNIIITKKKECKLIDFGISRCYQGKAASDTVVMGTELSAPPEQYGFAQTDVRSDIYSIGVLMFFMATGSMNIKELNQYQIPGYIRRIIRRCTRFSPKERYASVKQLKYKLITNSSWHIKRMLYAGGITGATAILILSLFIHIGKKPLPENDIKLDNGIDAEQVQAITENESSLPLASTVSDHIKSGTEQGYKFKSPLIEAAVREQLGKSASDVVLVKDLEQISSLLICGQQCYENWEEHFVYGVNQHMIGSQYTERQLYNINGEITSLEDIAYMVNLEKLALYNQKISDLAPLKDLHYLTYLGLGSNNISDLDIIAEINSLNYLDISGNPIMNDELEKLQELPYLWGLDVGATKVTSLYGLKDIKLRFLSLFECKVGDCLGLEEFTTLDQLIITGVNNAITSQAIDRITKLTNLKILKIFGSDSIDLSKLSTLRSLYLLDLCGMWNNSNLEGLSELTLSQLYMDACQKLELTGVEKLPCVEIISLRNSICSDYSPLLGVKTLKQVYCNQEQEQIMKEELGEVPFEIIVQ